MAQNFRIYSHRTRYSLYLKLDGDFDGNSAHELINTLIEHGVGLYQIFIDTNDLEYVHPFGREVFQRNLARMNKELSDLIFIGQNGHTIVQ